MEDEKGTSDSGPAKLPISVCGPTHARTRGPAKRARTSAEWSLGRGAGQCYSGKRSGTVTRGGVAAAAQLPGVGGRGRREPGGGRVPGVPLAQREGSPENCGGGSGSVPQHRSGSPGRHKDISMCPFGMLGGPPLPAARQGPRDHWCALVPALPSRGGAPLSMWPPGTHVLVPAPVCAHLPSQLPPRRAQAIVRTCWLQTSGRRCKPNGALCLDSQAADYWARGFDGASRGFGQKAVLKSSRAQSECCESKAWKANGGES